MPGGAWSPWGVSTSTPKPSEGLPTGTVVNSGKADPGQVKVVASMVASVGPYRLPKVPTRSRSASRGRSPAGISSPPSRQMRTSSAAPAGSPSAITASREGTQLMTFTRRRRVDAQNSEGESVWGEPMTTTQPPAVSVVKIWYVRASEVTADSRAHRLSSSKPRSRPEVRVLWASWRWVSATGRGRPVDPEVKKRMASSSGPGPAAAPGPSAPARACGDTTGTATCPGSSSSAEMTQTASLRRS